ncbi:expansin-like A3, partial [Actinidia rufa]
FPFSFMEVTKITPRLKLEHITKH